MTQAQNQSTRSVAVAEFLDFLPKVEKRTPKLNCSKVPAALGTGSNKAVYEPLVWPYLYNAFLLLTHVQMSAINRSKCSPSFKLCNTSGVKDVLTNLKPEGTLTMLPADFDDSVFPRDSSYVCAADIIFEVNSAPAETGAANAVPEDDAQDNEEKPDYLVKYVTKALGVQHRTFVYVVRIAGRAASLIRCDRAGTIASKGFDYVKTQHLAEFLWRYNNAAPSQRGHDETVAPASLEETKLFTTAASTYIAGLNNIDYQKTMKGTLDAGYPIRKVRVVDSKIGGASEYLVQRPFFEADCPTGRATRGYLAWACGSSRTLGAPTFRGRSPRRKCTICCKT